MANNTVADKLDMLAGQLSSAAQRLRSGALSLEADTRERLGLITAASDLVNIIGQPKDKMMMFLPMSTHWTSVRLFIKWKAFEKIPTDDGADISYAELAAKVGGDQSLITRFAQTLVANGTLRQIGTDRVAHTELSRCFVTENPIWGMAQFLFDSKLASYVAMPKYFDQFGIVEPKDRSNTIYAFAEGRLGSTVWDINHADEHRLKTITLAMGSVEEMLPALGLYDLSWVVQEAAKAEDRPLVVDVGGGRGQALKGMFAATPGLPRNRCVLEDLPEVVEAVRKEDAEMTEVKMVGTDFFKEQPVKGALVYYIRRCLHDYSDEECVEILRHISAAMAADSKLLIVETLLSNPPSALQAAMDIMMLAIGGKERNLEGFKAICGQAGLKITKVVENPGSNAVIECGLA